VKDGLRRSGSEIQVKTSCATQENFSLCLANDPVGLHFSGHGVKNVSDEVGL